MYSAEADKKSEDKGLSFIKEVLAYQYWKYEEKLQKDINAPELDQKINLAANFVEMSWTTGVGLQDMVSTNEEMTHATPALTNIFDSAVAVYTMTNNGIQISDAQKRDLVEILLANKSEFGGFNYFNRKYVLLPDDVDDSANAVLALLACDWSHAEAQKCVDGILKRVWVHSDDSLVDVYFKSGNTVDCNAISKYWPVKKRIDCVAIANFLFMLQKLRPSELPKFQSCVEFLSRVLDAFTLGGFDHPLAKAHLKNYTCINTVCFFISRVMTVFPEAKRMYQENMIEILQREMNKCCKKPLSLACQIMAGINIGMMENSSTAEIISCKIYELQNLQENDFGFQICPIYNAHKQIYFGSRAFSTAMAASALAMFRNK